MALLDGMPRGKREQLAERRVKVWELRKAGYSVARIARSLKTNVGSVRYDISKTLQELREQAYEDLRSYRDEELDRLGTLHAAMWRLACDGDVHAAMVCVRISDRRAKLLGLDAPVKVEADGVTFVQVLQQVAARLDDSTAPQPDAAEHPAA